MKYPRRHETILMTGQDSTTSTDYQGRNAARRTRILWLVASTIAFLPGGWATIVYGGLAGFFSDTCGLGDDSLICTGTGQGLTIAFPYVAVLAGFLLATVGGGLAVWRHSSLVPWLLSAWALLPLAVLASWSIGLRWIA